MLTDNTKINDVEDALDGRKKEVPKVRIEVVQLVTIDLATIRNLHTKYDGEDYCGEYQGTEYVTSYFIPWNKAEEFVSEVESVTGVNSVRIIPCIELGNLRIQSGSNLLVVNLESGQELVID